MKITLYTPFYPPQSQAAAVRCYWLARSLGEANHQVDVLTSISTPESKSLIFKPADNKQSFLKRLIFELLTGIELFFRLLFKSNGIVILSTPPFITTSIAHLACRVKGTKYIIDVRDIYPDIYFAEGLIKETSLLGNLVNSYTQKMYENSYAIFATTPGHVKKIKKLAPKAKSVELLLNGYDQDIFKPSNEKYPQFTIMFHGNMGKIQSLSTILKVAKSLIQYEDIQFIFIGEGPQSKLVEECGLKNVQYWGSKNYKEIAGLIAKAHVGFSARRDDEIGSDAFPVKVFEYLGVGIPVILTPKSGHMTKLIPEGIFEYANDDIEQISEKILELKNSSAAVSISARFSRQESSKTILSFIPKSIEK